jgi:integrase
VIVLDASAARRTESTVNRHLAAVFGFYEFHSRAGVALAESLVAWRRVPRGSFKPFLHHVTKGRPIPTRPVKLKAPRRLPVTLSTEQVTVILGACTRLRDRFLFALLAETGIRIGQALGLRHSDFISRRRELRIVPRTDNVNGARAKTRAMVTVPISTPLVRLYSEYMHTEYGDLDSDYVFVNLFADPVGAPLRYDAVAKLVTRLRRVTGIDFSPHVLRHTRGTELIRAGVPIEIVSTMLTHRSVVTTSETYIHLGVEDVRAELVRAGIWAGQGGPR